MDQVKRYRILGPVLTDLSLDHVVREFLLNGLFYIKIYCYHAMVTEVSLLPQHRLSQSNRKKSII